LRFSEGRRKYERGKNYRKRDDPGLQYQKKHKKNLIGWYAWITRENAGRGIQNTPRKTDPKCEGNKDRYGTSTEVADAQR